VLSPGQLSSYSYLLGMYLGDGYIARMPRTHVLRIYLHKDQREVVERVRRAISTLLPERRVGRVRDHESVTMVTCYFGHWPVLFPQHGPGRKHRRRIALESWQRDIGIRHPGEFIRGCIESDGCRHRRLVKGRNYPAYAFKNRSEDILSLFAWGCDLLGIRYRRANRVTISLARRSDVGRLDEIMGRPPEPGPFPMTRERARRPYSLRSYVGRGLPIRKFAMAATS
jgi:hypothetical protein